MLGDGLRVEDGGTASGYAANTLIKQPLTADKGWSSSWGGLS
jgi:hypothetical protein